MNTPRVDVRAPAPATFAVVGVLVAAYVIGAAAAQAAGFELAWEGPRPGPLRTWLGGMDLDRVRRGELWRLVTAGLVHVYPLHLIGNAMGIYALGRVMEPLLGTRRFLAVLVLGVLGGTVTSALSGIQRADGASAAAFALLGAGIVLGRRWPLPPGDRGLLVWIFAAVVVTNLALSFVVPALSLAAHTGGLLVGLLVGALARPGPAGHGWTVVLVAVAAVALGSWILA